MKRGEIWTASGGPDYAGKPRPVLLVQDDHFEDMGSITVCPLTTHVIDVDLVRPTIEPSEENGLRGTSFAMVDKITTISRGKLGERIGELGSAAMPPINRAMLVFLGLAGARG